MPSARKVVRRQDAVPERRRLESAAAVRTNKPGRKDGALAYAIIATAGRNQAGVIRGRRTARAEGGVPQRTFLEPCLGATKAKTPQGKVPIDGAIRALPK